MCQGDAFKMMNIANSRTGGVWLPEEYDLIKLMISREQILAIQAVRDPSPDRICRAELEVDAWSCSSRVESNTIRYAVDYIQPQRGCKCRVSLSSREKSKSERCIPGENLSSSVVNCERVI